MNIRQSHQKLHILNRSVEVSNPHASFVMSMFSRQTRIVLKTLSFKLQPLILNRCLPITFRTDQFRQSIDFAQRPVWGFEPPHFIFYLTVFPWDSNCATETSLQTGPTI